MKREMFFTGGYTEPILMGTGNVVQGRCKGISCYAFDPATGQAELIGCTASTPNPSYIIAHPEAPVLYCVNELKTYGEIEGSTVSAYQYDEKTGGLTLLSRQASCGADACHLSLTRGHKHLIVCNYAGGSIGLYPLRTDYGLDPLCCIRKHSGRGADPYRQASAHPHQAIASSGGDHVYITDLGLDKRICYRLVPECGDLVHVPERDIASAPGQGTRHSAFDRSAKHLYTITELTSSIEVFEFDEATGKTDLLQVSSCLPEAPKENVQGAAIRIHPNGKWLYCSLRGVDMLCCFKILEDGRLDLAQRCPSGGQTPREFSLSPDGKWLLCAHQDSDSICIHRIDQETGLLTLVNTIPSESVTTICFVP